MNRILKIALQKTVFFCLAFSMLMVAQSQSAKPKMAVFEIDSKVPEMDAAAMGTMLRTELEKMSMYDVLDRYDQTALLQKEGLSTAGCFGKICLMDIGQKLGLDYILTGTVDYLPETAINFTLKLLNVKTGNFDKTVVKEYLCFPKQVQTMLKLTLNDLYGQPNDGDLVEALSKKNSLESANNNLNTPTINLSGPRVGLSLFTGSSADVMKMPKNLGGYNAMPVLFQFGYQFEKQYVNEGRYQALFEFIPTVTGFVSNIFIPNFTFLNGFRNNRAGLEIAFGPTFSFVRKAEGFYRGDTFYLAHQYQSVTGKPVPNGNTWETRIDSRGDVAFNAAFVFAFGKTFRSGRLNIPVNGFVIPSKSGWRYGLSFGFNAKKNQ